MRGGSVGQHFRTLWLRARRSPGVLLTSEVGGRTDMSGIRLDSLLEPTPEVHGLDLKPWIPDKPHFLTSSGHGNLITISEPTGRDARDR